MYRVRVRRKGSLDNLLYVQIALTRVRRTNQVTLVTPFHVRSPRISLGIDRHGRDTHTSGCVCNPARDLTTIRDQQFFQFFILKSTTSYP